MLSIKFNKIVGKTLQTGKVTVPKEFDSFLDQHVNCPIGDSVDVEYIIEKKETLMVDFTKVKIIRQIIISFI